jgi:hypothetical protein
MLLKARDSIVELEPLLAVFLLSFVGVAALLFLADHRAKDHSTINDEAVIERNATAYTITTALFVGSLIVPTSFYYLADVDDNEAWPAVTAFLLSIILPVGYLGLRKFRGDPGFNEFLRYGELKDGWPRTWQIAVFVFWLVFVAAAVTAVLLMN